MALVEEWKEHPPVNLLLQALVEGYGRKGRKAAPTASPAASLPTATPFDAGQFNELVAAMGGVSIVQQVKT